MTEVSVGDFGRMIFEQAYPQFPGYALSPHWASIMQDAKPHIDALLALNEKMAGGGYDIHGIIKDGKVVRKRYDRIYDAQLAVLQVQPDQLKKGDYVWLLDEEFEHYPWQNDPVEVKQVGEMLIVEHPFERHGIHQPGGKILKAPDDWEDNEEYTTDEYWLKKADELGL